MNGYGIYANPLTDDWEDTIQITEYSAKDYDKSNLVPLRFKVGDIKASKDWELFDEQNIDFGKIRRDILTEMCKPKISNLPPIRGGKDTEFWSLENDDKKYSIKILYGDILDTENSPKIMMKFWWMGNSYYGFLGPEKDNIPDSFKKNLKELESYFYKKDYRWDHSIGWEEKSNSDPKLTNYSANNNVEAFMRWCVMTSVQPELLEYFKCKKVSSYNKEKLVIVPRNFEFNDEKLDAILESRYIENEHIFYADRLDELPIGVNEDGNITFGLDYIIAEMKKQEEQISMQESLEQALRSGVTAEDVARAKEVESTQPNKEAEIRTE